MLHKRLTNEKITTMQTANKFYHITIGKWQKVLGRNPDIE